MILVGVPVALAADSWMKVLAAYGAQPGAQTCSQARLPTFDPRFQKLLREMPPGEITPGTSIIDRPGST